MAGRRAVSHLTDERREALAGELKEYSWEAKRAEEELKIHVYKAFAAGMSTREIGMVLDKTSSTIVRWKDEGEQARERRRGGRLDESGEPEPVG
jgi:KaiC/GvpD/RAD55 family RecA-like ATPase